ncbi:evolutionarily conserved signaling intermediate in Toll pathway, mitochondrial, partial [Pipra filicauda]|uniref:Evolutionarily conserved signaling intermediate in Toll pathway, mitochondrial n=1 Tax=Pipra filicauda TaxID=649802 RepID=A0A7R5KBN5_9PASS
MRLSWVRALPPRLWGGPGAPQVARGLCQRPARDPSEGVTPTPGTPKPPHPRSPVPTPVWHKPSPRTQEENRDPQDPQDPQSHGPSWDGTSEGDTSRGDTLRGDTSRGDTSKGGPSRGGSSGGAPSGSDPSVGGTSKTPSPGPSSHKTHHDHHDGDPREGGPGDPSGRGDPSGAASFLAALEGTPPGRGGGRLALVEAALAALPALGLERDLGAYNGLLRLLPRGPWVPRGPVQRLLFPFPRQQECGLQLLEQMERYGVLPDAETQFLLLGVFGL